MTTSMTTGSLLLCRDRMQLSSRLRQYHSLRNEMEVIQRPSVDTRHGTSRQILALLKTSYASNTVRLSPPTPNSGGASFLNSPPELGDLGGEGDGLID